MVRDNPKVEQQLFMRSNNIIRSNYRVQTGNVIEVTRQKQKRLKLCSAAPLGVKPNEAGAKYWKKFRL